MATATTETETTVTLTLTQTEAEAVLVLTGCVAGGRTDDDSTHRDTSDGVYDALRSALNKSAYETDFYQAMNPGSRTVSLR